MKRILLTGAGLAVLGIAPAMAADLPARYYTKAPAAIPLPVYSWAGFYGGLNAGGGSSRNCWTLNNVAGVPVVPNQFEGCHDATGGMVGGQFGYRWQSASWVFGLEAQGDWTNFSGSNPSLAPLSAGASNQTRIDAIGLFTGQVGYAWNNLLWYTKGGAAVTHDKYAGLLTGTGIILDQANETRWGGTIGTGLEYAFAPNWSVGVEYDHLFMGKSNIGFAATTLATSRADSIKQDVDIGTVRVNYRFGAPLVAKY
ncbi:MAG: porin family protein [Bradyrhizobium sp.]|uniref:outer membrane protein n=1 Tax=Bradyrhizobium sp. TaxID=376 RepID=UPI001DEC2B6A|nr:outer membrane beta-barrel protein [Bradyrhizobium sp.]MBV9564810.1 porin family protein [Bradyrhizobium sp.]